HADVLPRRSDDGLRSHPPVDPGRARAPAAGFAVRSGAHEARVGSRIRLRHRRPRIERDAVRESPGRMTMPIARTPSQAVGPFFDFCLTPDRTHGRLFPDSGSRIRLMVRVIDGAGDPVPDAVVEIWQASDRPGGDAGFGRLGTREDGSCEFDTVR